HRAEPDHLRVAKVQCACGRQRGSDGRRTDGDLRRDTVMEYAKLIRKTGDINELAKTQRDKVSRVLAQTAQEAAAIATQIVPVRTGALRASIFVQQDGDLRFLVGASQPYASFVELGTSRMEAQPYIGPAVNLARRHLIDLLQRR